MIVRQVIFTWADDGSIGTTYVVERSDGPELLIHASPATRSETTEQSYDTIDRFRAAGLAIARAQFPSADDRAAE